MRLCNSSSGHRSVVPAARPIARWPANDLPFSLDLLRTGPCDDDGNRRGGPPCGSFGPTALVGADGDLGGDVDGGAGRLRHQHRPPARPGRAGHQRREPAVGGDRLRPRLRRSAAARGARRRLRRPQARLPDRPGRFRRRLHARGYRPEWDDAVRRTRPARRIRRTAGPGRTVPDRGHLHRTARAGQGVRRLRGPARCGRCGRTDRGRPADRVHELVLVRQHPHRPRRGPGRPAGTQGEPRRGPSPLRHPWRPAGHHRAGRRRLGLHPRRGNGLEHPGDLAPARRRPGAAGLVRPG
ncbi:hypothetical protein SCALM49S_01137 [Streptomyces californicus]